VRVAVGGIRHETNTFSTLRTGLAEFRVERGDEIQVPGAHGVEIVGTLVAGASPHGLVEHAAYQALKVELLDRLRAALPVDGVFLDLHGAMEVARIGDGESDLAAAVRALVGPAVPISASLDLHANISPALVAACDAMTALRTAPHRDGVETRARAMRLLLRALREGRRPVTAMAKPPILIAGESAVTDVEPARSLYGLLPSIDARPGVLDASVIIGCAWTDSPYTSTAALAVAWEREVAEREARQLGEEIWRCRAEFRPDAETAPLDAAVPRALAAPSGPVFVSDSGDNVTAGGAGDLPLVLAELLRVGAERALVAGLSDAAAVAACAAAGAGATVRLALGGKLDAVSGRPLPVDATVARLGAGWAVVRVGGVDVAVTADRRAFTTLAGFAALGLDPLAYRVVVVKQGYLFPELRDAAAGAPRILALTPGFTDLELTRLPYRRLTRPIYPLDGGVTWSP
jgi:microcystin degradation protein MlrC